MEAISSRIFVPAYPFSENISSAAARIFSLVPFGMLSPSDKKMRPIGHIILWPVGRVKAWGIPASFRCAVLFPVSAVTVRTAGRKGISPDKRIRTACFAHRIIQPAHCRCQSGKPQFFHQCTDTAFRKPRFISSLLKICFAVLLFIGGSVLSFCGLFHSFPGNRTAVSGASAGRSGKYSFRRRRG